MSYKLLLADDSVTIQRVIELTFADEDVKVIAVGDGQQAIDRIEAELPDIVLADVGMPSRDGYQVATYVKNTPHLAHIPVLLLTGAFEPVDEERARAAACDGVLAKPFEPQMVIARVKELLATSAARPQAAPVAAEAEPADVMPADLLRWSPEEAAVPRTDDDTLAFATETPDVPPLSQQIEAAPDFDVRIRRRPPVIPGEPQPVTGVDDAMAEVGEGGAGVRPLDDYFNRLDAAFATLGRSADLAEPAPQAGAPVVDQGLPAEPASPRIQADGEMASTRPAEFRASALLPPAPPGVAAQAAAEPLPGSDQSPVAQAFSALLAAERGDLTALPLPGIWPAQGLTAQAVDEIVDRVTREVIERLTDRTVREAVTDAVSRIAERLIREEIDRVKATIK